MREYKSKKLLLPPVDHESESAVLTLLGQFWGRSVSITITEINDSMSGSVILLPSGSKLWIPIHQKYCDNNLLPLLTDLPVEAVREHEKGVVVTLEEDMVYRWIDGRAGRSPKTKCQLNVPKGSHLSVNKAYTAASKFFETKRTSNTTNIYKTIMTKKGDKYQTLDELRQKAISAHFAPVEGDGQ